MNDLAELPLVVKSHELLDNYFLFTETAHRDFPDIEREILHIILSQKKISDESIAERIGISSRELQVHLERIYRYLDFDGKRRGKPNWDKIYEKLVLYKYLKPNIEIEKQISRINQRREKRNAY